MLPLTTYASSMPLSSKSQGFGVVYSDVPSLVHYFPCNEGSTVDNNTDEDIIVGHTYNKLNDVVGNVILSKDHTYSGVLTRPPTTFTWHGNDAVNPSPIGTVQDHISVNFSPNDEYEYPFVGDWEDIGTDCFILIIHWATAITTTWGFRIGELDTDSNILADVGVGGCSIKDTLGNTVANAAFTAANTKRGVILALDRSDDTFYSIGFDSNYGAEILSTDASEIGSITPTQGINVAGNQVKQTAGVAMFKMATLPVSWKSKSAWCLTQWQTGNRVFHPDMISW